MTQKTSKTNPTTDAEKAEIVRLREEGVTKSAIARRMGKSIGTITHWCLMLGAEPPEAWKPSKRPRLPFVRDGRSVVPFTNEEDVQMRAWAAEGVPYTEIAHKLQRAPTSIRYRMLTLARHEGLLD